MIIRGNTTLFKWAIAGSVFLVLGLLLAFVIFPVIVDDQIYRQVRLKNGTDQYDRWKQLPVGIEFKIYLFHVKNWREVTFEGAKPEVEEKGPYVYKEFRRKENITYDEAEDSLTYIQYTRFEFDEELSGDLREDDKVVTLNAGLNAIFQVANRYFPEILMKALVDNSWQYMFPDVLEGSVFHEVSAGDILFKGYRFCDPENWNSVAGVICVVAALLDTPFIEVQEDFSLKFAFFSFKQDKHDGVFTVNAGIKDVSKIGLITQWNGYAYNTIWKDRMSSCNKIKGRDGTIYAPDMQKEDVIDVFSTEICRTGVAAYDGEDKVSGITVQRRVLGADTLGDPETYPNNYCYCGKHERDLYGNKKCLPDGFSDLSPCYMAPVIASYPHFLFGDQKYAETVIGLDPVPEKHQTVLMVEPLTGTPMSGRKRLQFNMILRPVPGITVLENIVPNVCPIAWVEEGMLVPDDLLNTFKTLLHVALTAVDVIKWLITAIGACLLVGCGGRYYYKLKKYGPKE